MDPVPYRAPDLPEPDREPAAIADLDRRVRRLRNVLVLGIFALVIPTCVGGYDVVQEIQFAMAGRAFIWLNAAIGCGVPLGLGFKLIDRVVPRIVARMVARWLPEIAARHGVMLENLAEYTTHLRP
jgi:hypothetical protein